MDPPDILGVDPSTARPTQLPGRAKSEWLFPFPLPIACTKPLSLRSAARVMGWTFCLPAATCFSQIWGQQRCWGTLSPGHVPLSAVWAAGGSAQLDSAPLPFVQVPCPLPTSCGWAFQYGDLSKAAIGRELRHRVCATTPLNLWFSLGGLPTGILPAPHQRWGR